MTAIWKKDAADVLERSGTVCCEGWTGRALQRECIGLITNCGIEKKEPCLYRKRTVLRFLKGTVQSGVKDRRECNIDKVRGVCIDYQRKTFSRITIHKTKNEIYIQRERLNAADCQWCMLYTVIIILYHLRHIELSVLLLISVQSCSGERRAGSQLQPPRHASAGPHSSPRCVRASWLSHYRIIRIIISFWTVIKDTRFKGTCSIHQGRDIAQSTRRFRFS